MHWDSQTQLNGIHCMVSMLFHCWSICISFCLTSIPKQHYSKLKHWLNTNQKTIWKIKTIIKTICAYFWNFMEEYWTNAVQLLQGRIEDVFIVHEALSLTMKYRISEAKVFMNIKTLIFRIKRVIRWNTLSILRRCK